MTSRLDRLFSLLENCPNASLRSAAAQQLGELAENLPNNVDHIFVRLIPLLHSRSWISRVAAAEAIRSIVRHLPSWSPSTDNALPVVDSEPDDGGGFLSLADLRLDRVLAQGARLYSMDVRELERPATKRSATSVTDLGDAGDAVKENGPPQSPLAVQRHELNKRLGLDDDNVVTSVLATHANVSLTQWISPEDLEDKEVAGINNISQLDVATCVKTAYDAQELKKSKRPASACSDELDSHRLSPKQPRSESHTNVKGNEDDDQSVVTWPLDKMCTTLLGDLWALRWETRHGAASGLRELLSEPRHTQQAGKRAGMMESKMQESNSRYLEDIVVRVLCTLALDQLSDFVSDEVVAPVRETAAQLLGVLSRHLSADRVLLVTHHLIYLISLKLTADEDTGRFPSQSRSSSTASDSQPAVWKNNWMIVHGGLLGIKYLLASRKDLRSLLLPLVTPCLVAQLVGSPAANSTATISTTQPDSNSLAAHSVADEDIRAAAASALIPVIDVDWLTALGPEQAYRLIDHVWQLLRDCTHDLSPSTGPLLQLICVLTRASTANSQDQGLAQPMKKEESEKKHVKIDSEKTISSFDVHRMHFQLDVLAHLIHHVSSGIRSNALIAMQCVLDTWKEKLVPLPPNLLQLVIDQLFHRILLETSTSVRGLATKLCIDTIESSDLTVCTQACVERLDFWLCQIMQPVGIPFPPHLFTALVPVNPVTFVGQVEASSDAVHQNSSDVTMHNSQLGTNCGTPSQPASSHEHGYCIGGSHVVINTPMQQEAFVWETRMCAIRVLARLLARVCQCTQIGVPISKLPSASESSTSTGSVNPMNLLLPFFLDQLLCGLHLEQRLAMQRFVAGLVLSSWSLLSAGPTSADHTWATVLSGQGNPAAHLESSSELSHSDLAALSLKLRSRLEACLTEVIYYEEILGLFKLMQEDCRELIRVLEPLGITDDPVFLFKGARTIAQCLTMLDKASLRLSELNTASPPTDESVQSELVATAAYKLDRARSTVERCLALQLHWGSRVEFAIASALSNLNWLLPGRLSLLIRPFMDTIRCICPTPSASESQSGKNLAESCSAHLLPVGSNSSIQRLATACLARVLQLEWLTHRQKFNTASSVSSAPNPSKAAVKVIKNLAAAMLESDPQLLSLTNEENISTNSQPPVNPEMMISDEPDLARRLPKQLSSSDLTPSTTNDSHTVWQDARYRGSSLALAYLCQTFLQPGMNECISPQQQPSLQRLQLGLPGLWNLMWSEPVQLLRDLLHGARDPGTTCVDREVSLRPLLKADLFNRIQQPAIKSHESAICTGLLTLSTCVPALLPCLPPSSNGTTDTTGASDPPMSFEQLVYLGTIAAGVPSNPIRVLGAKLLTSLTIQRTVETLNLLLPLMLGYLDTTGRGCTTVACTGTLEALAAIVEQVSQTSTSDTGLWLDCADPLAEPETTGSRPVDTPETDGPVDSVENRLSPLLCKFLPYIVALVPPVLRLLADPEGEVRVLASKLFTSLLTLFPLEASLPDPPGMDPELCVARATKRQFIDSLLHPDRIQRYNLPIPIQAKLRGYQQDGVNWLSFLNRYGLNGILCDDLGLGKTLQTLCILAGSHYELKHQYHVPSSPDRHSLIDEEGDNDTSSTRQSMSLVVCPSTLSGHWLHEVEQFVLPRDLLPVVYSGGPAARLSLQAQIFNYNLVIASYDLVRNDLSFFQSIFWNYIVLDEGHIIKSSKSKVTRSLKQLRARHRLILTGTPIQNRVCELWSLFDFLMPDFLGSESNFNSRFSRPVAASRDPKASRAEQRAGHLALERLHRLVLPFMLRRMKEDVLLDLPPKIIQDFACEMTSIQLMLYEDFLKSNEGRNLMKTIQEKDDREVAVTYGGVRHGFQALRYLQAVCNHPCLALKPSHPVLNEVKRALQTDYGARVALNSVHLSGKLLALCRLLTDCGFGTPNLERSIDQSTSVSTATNAVDDLADSSRSLLNQHRALIFFQTREMLQLTEEMLRAQFPWITSTRLDGSVPLNERYARVTRFNSDPSIDLMLLTTAVGGLGLNLTGADTVIFVEHDWNPSKDLQAMDRVHRIGQRRTVNVYRLITQDSIEEQIMNLQAFKLHLANTVVTADNRHLTGMDTGHLFDRFTAQTSTNEDTSHSAEHASKFDSLEECYEMEYDLDAFVARLK